MWWTTWWMTLGSPVHHVVDDTASTGTLSGGWSGGLCDEHRHTMWWMTWRALVHHVVDDAASTGTRCAE